MPGQEPVSSEDTVDVSIDDTSVREVVGVRYYPPGTPMASITVEVGATVELAPYQNVRVRVGVSRPVPDSDEMINDQHLELRGSVMDLLCDAVDQAAELFGGK